MATLMETPETHRIEERAALYRHQSTAFAEWAAGYGVIRHDDLTQVRIYEMADLLHQQEKVEDTDTVYRILAAADRIASAAMWLVVHMTYAREVRLDGRDLERAAFKLDPEGHTGGALNMVPAYVGYLAINTLTRCTRSWLMGQGHAVAAIEATNLVVGNMSEAHAQRYALTDAGLTRFVRDFYSYEVRADGKPAAPLGSHVNAHTAGGLIEGGYLGFAELKYPHMPLPGERLVVFLSDGAFEEQRGSDWAPRWWRAEDCGLIAPIMIANGRRIDQRTSLAMKGGVEWFREHLRLNGFTPIDLDGRDPAAFAWGIFEIEENLTAAGQAIELGHARYPVPLFYGIAETVKGYGFPGADTQQAHNLPLGANPSRDAEAAATFNQGARRLWVPLAELNGALRELNRHELQHRPRERDHPLTRRQIDPAALPPAPWRTDGRASPMEAIDRYFCEIVDANPHLRPRVGNPDEMRSNRLNRTLDKLKHRVVSPEPGVAESLHGAVITALNEEAVVCAALGNKGGINLVASYEAFAVKMLGAIRQELVFARHLRDAGRAPGWLAVPVILTSHTWENGKNEQSHQDTTLAEALLGEMSDVARVRFPADWNTALASLADVYRTHGQIHTLVIPKNPVATNFTPEQAQALIRDGALRLRGTGEETLLLIALGAYQLQEAILASDRMHERGVAHALVYLYEPGRFRAARDAAETAIQAPDMLRQTLFPDSARARVFVCHTRPEPLLGAVWPLVIDPARTRALGYRNQGGTLDTAGMLFANRSTWAHIVAAAAEVLARPAATFLGADEHAAVEGRGSLADLVKRAS